MDFMLLPDVPVAHSSNWPTSEAGYFTTFDSDPRPGGFG